MKTYLVVYFGAALISLLVTALVIRLARAIGAMDRPGLRKIHSKPVPRIGGIAIVAATIAVLLPVLLLDNVIGAAFRQNLPQIVGLLCGAVFVFAVGLVDDIRGLRVRHKLVAQLAAAIALCAVGVRIDVLRVEGLFHLEFGWLGWPLTIVWIVGITNAINLIDGLDGLAAGISAITCAVIAAFSWHVNQPIMAVLMLAMFGALTAFLFFGFNPAKVFLGDCGSLFLGFMLAGASVLSSTKTMTAVGLALPVLAMGVPIFDTLFSMLRRFLERRSMFAPDRSHIHHRLLAMGLHQRHVVLMLYGVTILAAGLGMFMMITRNVGTLLVFLCVVMLLMLIFRIVGAVRLGEAVRRLQQNLAIAGQYKRNREGFEQAQLLLREAESFQQWWRSLCSAADKLRVGCVRLTLPGDDGSTESLSWSRDERPGQRRNTVQMRFQLGGRGAAAKSTIEIEVPVAACLELASHRAKLFGRLMDEHDPGDLRPAYRAERAGSGEFHLDRSSPVAAANIAAAD